MLFLTCKYCKAPPDSTYVGDMRTEWAHAGCRDWIVRASGNAEAAKKMEHMSRVIEAAKGAAPKSTDMVRVTESWGPNGEHKVQTDAGDYIFRSMDYACEAPGHNETIRVERVTPQALTIDEDVFDEDEDDERCPQYWDRHENQCVLVAYHDGRCAYDMQIDDRNEAASARRANALSDECGALKSENTALLAENARLRRALERKR